MVMDRDLNLKLNWGTEVASVPAYCTVIIAINFLSRRERLCSINHS